MKLLVSQKLVFQNTYLPKSRISFRNISVTSVLKSQKHLQNYFKTSQDGVRMAMGKAFLKIPGGARGEEGGLGQSAFLALTRRIIFQGEREIQYRTDGLRGEGRGFSVPTLFFSVIRPGM